MNRKASRNERRPGLRFVVTAAVLSVSLFGLLRIPFVEQNLLLPFTKAQHGLACRIGGDPNAPISVGLSCSASDVIALCLGFILAFPVAWYKRLLGAFLGLIFIAAVNTVRIATLSHAVENRRWFDLLHVYIWPGMLLIVVSLFVFLWMSFSLHGGSAATRSDRGRPLMSRVDVRFVLLTLFFVALFVGSSGWWMQSPSVSAVAHWVAATGAFVIRLFGGQAEVTGNVLRTASGGFVVTQECIMTPLIPAYFAAAFALNLSRKQRVLTMLLAFPVFFALGAARLLVLAFPTRVVGSHLIAIHGFYQFLLAALLIVAAAALSAGQPRTLRRLWRPSLAALAAAALTAYLIGLTYGRWVAWTVERVQILMGHGDHLYRDPQGALLIMIPYQLGLSLGLWIAWRRQLDRRRVLIGLILLLLTQPLVQLVLGEWVVHTGLEPHVAAIRAWSVLSVLAIGLWIAHSRSRTARRRTLSPPEPQHG